ncbi:CRISPR-associated endonuclease Cas3'' [Pontibacillus halophilus]|uniref:CRISPR-associated endonuclease Cas3'' n=1 Tax=Pontibacillus halophilus TaxID=516704 RepID=UPI00040CBC01|nr:CRISPR-associated endonuclease Cas3'' [Pontibacillus halophilus]
MNVDWNRLAKSNPAMTIGEHTEEVIKIGKRLLAIHDKPLTQFAETLPDSFFRKTLNRKEEIQAFILDLIRYHDVGKTNPYFQERMEGKRVKSSESSHALYSFLIWATKEAIHSTDYVLLSRLAIGHATISGHHGELKSYTLDFMELLKNQNEKTKRLVYWGIIEDKERKSLLRSLEILKRQFSGESYRFDKRVCLFARFAYSILVTSDALASGDGGKEEVFTHLFERTLDQVELEDRMNHSPIFQRIAESPLSSDVPFHEEMSMNELRTLLNKKAKDAYDPIVDAYILEAPVGTGKTYSSLSLAQQIAKKEGKRKLISVFPLNGVQAQYLKTMEAFDISPDLINVVNAESTYRMKRQADTFEEELGMNAANLWLYERELFSTPIVITSHVRFFDVLAATRRNRAYAFLSLLDAIVIVDEFQTYPSRFWSGIWEELLLISELMGTKWVFTTGTFPVQEEQLLNLHEKRVKKVLAKEDNEVMFSHQSVRQRTEIKELLAEEKPVNIEDLIEPLLIDIEQEMKKGKKRFLTGFNLVSHAQSVHEALKARYENEIPVYFLCGRHSSSYKGEIINAIIKAEDADLPIILIATRTVEAGMDFDFDVGYKEFDRFDGVEQFSGRVNRSGKKRTSPIKVFRLKRRLLGDEPLFSHGEKTRELLNEGRFVDLYGYLYERNGIDIQRKEEELRLKEEKLNFRGVSEWLQVIQPDNYVQDIYVVLSFEREAFLEAFSTLDGKLSYAERVQRSIQLRQKIEPYKVTVTLKWLDNQKEITLPNPEEYMGISFFQPYRDDFRERHLCTYALNGEVSYLEDDREQEEETFDFY